MGFLGRLGDTWAAGYNSQTSPTWDLHPSWVNLWTAVDRFKPSVNLFSSGNIATSPREPWILVKCQLLFLGASPLYCLCHSCPVLHQQKHHCWKARLGAHLLLCTGCPHAQQPWWRDTVQPSFTDKVNDMRKVTQLQSSRAWIWTWVFKFWQCPLPCATLNESKESTAEPLQRIASLGPVSWRDSSWPRSLEIPALRKFTLAYVKSYLLKESSSIWISQLEWSLSSLILRAFCSSLFALISCWGDY